MTRPLALSLVLSAAAFLPSCASPPPAAVPADARPVTMRLNGLSCPLCATNADKSLIRIGGVLDARTDLQSGEVEIWIDPAAPPTDDDLNNAVLDAGFTPGAITTPGNGGAP